MGLEKFLKSQEKEKQTEMLSQILAELKATNTHLKRIDYDISIIKNKVQGEKTNEKVS